MHGAVGRPSALDRASKIVSADSLTEKRQSTRKLSRRLKPWTSSVSHDSPKMLLLVPTKITKLTEEHGENWLKLISTGSTGPKKIGIELFSVVRVLMKFIYQEL